MTEEQVFLAALELPKAADRAAYLETACGGNTELRRQVEELLVAHFKSGEFLDVPIGRQAGLDATTPSAVTTSPEHASAVDLHFLEPTAHPDSLGRIGSYEALQILGQGGFGIVFRAFDEVLKRVVALKVLAPHIAATSPARKRFLREAQASARVRHENVVQVHAVEERPLPYLVMEYIAGETLQQRLDRIGPLEPEEIVAFGRQIAEGLAAAHATGLIHRDVKPGNILIEEGVRERIKLTDFGLARAADDASMTQSGILAGTPMYMAPEQAQGETLDQRADLFSLGSVLYVMASGRPPFRAATTFAVLKRVVEEPARPIADLIPECPPWLCEIIAKLHAKKPADRYQSAREVADLLARCEVRMKTPGGMRELGGVSPRASAAGRPARRPWLAAAALLLPILAIAVTEFAGVTHFFGHRESKTTRERVEGNSANVAAVVAANVPTSESPPEKVPAPANEPSVERRAAKYALALGGKIRFQTADGSQLITSIAELPAEDFQLTGVFLSTNPGAVTDDGLALLKDCADLQSLDLAFCSQVTDEGILPLKQCRKLTYLNLAATQLTDAGLACCKELDALYFLVLDQTQITDAGLKENFSGRRNITWLQLSRMPQVTDAGLAAFRDCTAMQRLYLDGTPITDDGAALLVDMPRLIEVWIDKCQVTQGFVAKLSRQLPQCRIRWDGETIKPTAGKISFTEADRQRIAALPAAEQVAEVAKELQRLNPGFDGELAPKTHDGAVYQLALSTEHVSDLTPLRAFKGLSSLELHPGKIDRSPLVDLSPLAYLPLTRLRLGSCRVSDLTPLKRLPLVSLDCSYTLVTDLSPLSELPLQILNCGATQVSDLTPLRGLKLTVAYLEGAAVADLTPLQGMPLVTLSIGTKVTDLRPLRGMQLRSLTCAEARGLSDLSPLAEMPLKLLNLYGTQVSDLSPLEGMSLDYLSLHDTPVTDLAPLRKLQTLKRLHCSAKVTDLSPLQDLALETFDFAEIQSDRDAPILRAISTLKTINGRPTAELGKEAEQ